MVNTWQWTHSGLVNKGRRFFFVIFKVGELFFIFCARGVSGLAVSFWSYSGFFHFAMESFMLTPKRLNFIQATETMSREVVAGDVEGGKKRRGWVGWYICKLNRDVGWIFSFESKRITFQKSFSSLFVPKIWKDWRLVWGIPDVIVWQIYLQFNPQEDIIQAISISSRLQVLREL